MSELQVFILKNCPYCRKALVYLEELQQEEKFKDIKIKFIDEAIEKDLANSYDYYYVPSFFFNDVKLAEGAVDLNDVRKVLDKVLSS